MPVQIACPNPDCDSTYSVADENLGKLGRCKKCGNRFPLVPGTRVDAEPAALQTEPEPTELSAQAKLPESFGRYKVVRLLGKGGMGSVYLALDTRLNRQVALKVPHLHVFADRPDIRERFFREAQAAARFHHPNFCSIHDIGEVDGVPFLTMAYIEGKTLAASIKPNQGWPARRAAEVVRELALALAKAHHEGIIHRDLKPANIMIDADGRMILMDFGLARWYDDLDSTLTPTGAILGTPAYMSPEQAEPQSHPIGPRSDLYSLGVILYELMTGRRPFDGPVAMVFSRLLFVEPDPPSSVQPGIDPRLEAICMKAMAKKPEDRHVSMDEFAGALTEFLEQPPTFRPPQSRPSTNGPRKPVRTVVAAALMLVAILFGIIYVATDKGRIKIEVNDPNAVVTVKGHSIRIEGTPPAAVKNDPLTPKAEPKPTLLPDPMPPVIVNTDPPPATVEPTPRPLPDSIPPVVVRNDPPPSVNEVPIVNSIGMKLKLIPAGEFMMGSDASDPAAQEDERVKGKKHRVRITKPFYMGQTEVTVGQFRDFISGVKFFETDARKDEKGGYGWIRLKNSIKHEQNRKYSWRITGFPQTDDHPVTNVSWNDAVAFCDWLSKEEGETYRLPTEAEWEYACRAGLTTRYSSGDDPETLATVGNLLDSTALEVLPHYSNAIKARDGFVFTAPVGQFQPNAFGLFDMHGNVWEWCQDRYEADYYAKGPVENPQNAARSAVRVLRGGSWTGNSQECRSACRNSTTTVYRCDDVGFRVVRVVKAGE